MKHTAFLIGISRYPDCTLAGIPNDVELVGLASLKHRYPTKAIHCFTDSHTTLSGLPAMAVSRTSGPFWRLMHRTLTTRVTSKPSYSP